MPATYGGAGCCERKKLKKRSEKSMMIIPNIIDPSVPIGKDDSENVEIETIW